MNALAPPKQKRRLCRTPLRKLRLLAAYRIAALLATTFAWPFWVSEQWRSRIGDRIDNEGSDQ
jgi:hypothetical protein